MDNGQYYADRYQAFGGGKDVSGMITLTYYQPGPARKFAKILRGKGILVAEWATGSRKRATRCFHLQFRDPSLPRPPATVTIDPYTPTVDLIPSRPWAPSDSLVKNTDYRAENWDQKRGGGNSKNKDDDWYEEAVV